MRRMITTIKDPKVTADDSRRYFRIALHGSISVFDKDDYHHVGFVMDLSEGGFMLNSSIPLQKGTRWELKLVDMPADGDSKRVGECHGQVIWSHRISPSVYYVGFQFTQLSAEATAMVESHRKNGGLLRPSQGVSKAPSYQVHIER